MEMAVRDSGICIDTGDDDSSEPVHFRSDVTTISKQNNGKFTFVRKLAKQFESLTVEQQQYHAKCNWWLDKDQNNENDGETEHATDRGSYRVRLSRLRSEREGRRSR